jgi:hypothetical protein
VRHSHCPSTIDVPLNRRTSQLSHSGLLWTRTTRGVSASDRIFILADCSHPGPVPRGRGVEPPIYKYSGLASLTSDLSIHLEVVPV